MLKIYYASPFFEKGNYNKSKEVVEAIRKELGEKVEVYLPQENGDINDKADISKLVTAKDIARGDNKHLKKADILIADLDGAEIDSGVSAEIGYIAGKNSHSVNKAHIIGFNTDMRINNTNKEVLELIRDSEDKKALEIIENLKYNNLYRNLYTVGLVEEWGTYIVDADKYIERIVEEVEKIVTHKEILNCIDNTKC